MQIGELAKRTTLTVDAIRFYEKRRLLPEPARTVGRFRLYAPEDIERLNFIHQMHRLGFSLREIRELTGWNASLIKVRAFRARKKLRKQFAKILKEERR